MDDLKTRVIEELLKTITYDDMTKEQLELVSEYEVEKYKPHIHELKDNCSNEEIAEYIHDWWQDYEIADETEDKLLEYLATLE